MAAYCTEEDVKSASSKWMDDTTEETTRVTAAIIQASAFVDQQCGTWFDPRSLTIQTQPAVPGQKKLFFPARIVSVSAVVENGASLNVATQLVVYRTWIEKRYTAGSFGGQNLNCWPSWSPGQLNIAVTGIFGFAAVPDDIVRATAHIAAMLLGWVNRQYVASDGSIGASLVLALPVWVKQTLTNHYYGMLMPQPFLY